MSERSNYWEDLRRQARRLENQLDQKLASFSKLCAGYGSSGDGRRGQSSDTTPLLDNDPTQDGIVDTTSAEIEQLLVGLAAVNDRMAECAGISGGAASLGTALDVHTRQRHRDVLQDYAREFHRTKGNVSATRERDELLGSARKDAAPYESSGGSAANDRRLQLVLAEQREQHEHLRSSDRLVDDAIVIAMATKDNVSSQRGVLKSIRGRVNTVSDDFPAINSLIRRINLRKRRDSLILGGVMGVCVLLLLFALR